MFIPIKQPQVGDVWTSKTGHKAFFITAIKNLVVQGNCVEGDVELLQQPQAIDRKGKFYWYAGGTISFWIRGNHKAGNKEVNLHGDNTSDQIDGVPVYAGQIVPPDLQGTEVLGFPERNRLRRIADERQYA